MSKTLLLLSNRQDDANFAAEIAQIGKYSFKQVFHPAEAAGSMDRDDIAAVLIDASSREQFNAFEDAVQDKLGLFSDKVDTKKIHFISPLDLELVTFLVNSPLFGNFLLRRFGDIPQAAKHYYRLIRLGNIERAFGLAEIFGDGTKVQTVHLQSSTQKLQAVEAVRNYLVQAKFQTRMATIIANAVDELLMNSIFDAPVDELGHPLYSRTPRNTMIALDGKAKVEMQIGYNDGYVGVSAVDHFGSLDRNKLLSHIAKVYTDENYQVKTSVAGAGIGLSTVFRSGGSFIFASEAGERTEATVFFRRAENYRKFKDQFRFLSTFFYF